MKPVRNSFRFAIAGEWQGSAPPYSRRAEPGGSLDSSGRAGATLTEVLMAILIMAIGIVSVFTLFPISVLRTIQATQQTNSKIHKLNAQELVKTSPGVLTQFEPPPLPFVLPVPYRFQGEQWRPNTAYLPGTIVVPTMIPGDSHPMPLVWYLAVAGPGGDTNGSGYLESGTNEPVWLPQASVLDGELQWDPILDAAGIPLSYVVDPLGYNLAIDDATSPPAGFGNKTNPATGVGVAPPGGSLLRIHGGVASTPAAIANVSQLDHWEEAFGATPLSATFTTVTFPPSVDLTGLSAGIRRLVITSSDGNKTIYRAISSIDPVTRQVTLNPSEPIPNSTVSFPQDGAGNPDIGMARVEVFSRRFSWFLTVRNSAAGDPDIKCVVVFNRNFASASEHVYDANFGDVFDRVDVDNFGGPDATQHGLTRSSNWVKIVWPDTEPQPLLKPGNWLFDARDVTWYRIQEVFDRGTGGGVNFAVLFLDRNVRRQSQPAPAPTGQAILMPGIVEVFNM